MTRLSHSYRKEGGGKSLPNVFSPMEDKGIPGIIDDLLCKLTGYLLLTDQVVRQL